MKYIKKFDAVSAQTAYLESTKLDTYVGYVSENDSVYYEDAIPDYSKMYLTFDIISGGTIGWAADNYYKLTAQTISYSLDNGSTWTNITSSKYGTIPTINVNDGDKVLLKGNNATYGYQGYGNYFSGTAVFNAAGNIMSLISGDSFQNITEITGSWVFDGMFKSAQLISAENLILPATTLSNSCYMRMFQNCTSLTTAPVLSATTLVSACYFSMFNGCTNLNYVKCLATENLSNGNNTSNWLNGVSATGTFVKDANATWPSGASGIPDGWTIQNA